jgi:hypothetical protein
VTTDPLAARRLAGELVADLRQASPEVLAFEGVDLAGAIEQRLFFAIRDGVPAAASPGGVTPLLRAVGAAAVGLLAWRLPKPGSRPLVVLVREPAHYPALASIEGELQAAAGESLALLRVGRAATVPPAHAVAPTLVELMEPRQALRARAHARRMEAAMTVAARQWSRRVEGAAAAGLAHVVAREAGSIVLGVAGLLSAASRWQPALLAAFDEIGTWARLLPAVASRSGIPSLDLPHAEAADAVAIRGAGYDCMATYGPRASEVLLAAGVPRHRIVEIGAPRMDGLVRLVGHAEEPVAERRVVFAAQYVTGAMTREALASCFDAARAAARAFDAAELVVVPHPAEPPGTAANLVADLQDPGIAVRLARDGLQAEVTRAALLVTGWSNSVFEAAVAGIPAIAVNPGGVAPVDFAADGLAVGATDAGSAAAVAVALRDEEARASAVERSQRAAAERLGPLDGRAAERAARLMLALARGEPWRSAA